MLTRILKDITPPALWRVALECLPTGRSVTLRGRTYEFGAEQPAEFYDAMYESNAHWNDHYTQSRYYPLWTVILDRIGALSCVRILDIGCGPGQVACLLRDAGIPVYTGIDFSPARVRRARSICPEYDFQVADVFETTVFQTDQYDCVLMMEFLEHVERDLDAIGRIRSGAAVIATVPNFPSAGHVRHFADVDEVSMRYSTSLSNLQVTPVAADPHGKMYFILQGVR